MKAMMNKAPMGWNSYDYYDTTVNEAQVRANADYLAKNLKAYGWEYVVVDIEWYSKDAGTQRDKHQYIPFGDIEMDAYGRLQPDPERFPSSAGGKGFGPLAEYVHSLGLKFGIHIMRGIPREAAHKHLPILGTTATANEVANPSSVCGWNPDMYGVRKNEPGSQEYYDSIIRMYADWGVDFIKCDDICNIDTEPTDAYSSAHEIEMLAKASEKSQREIVLSLSPGPARIERAWHYEKYANMWRITDDFWDDWKLLAPMFWRCELWQNHVEEGSYPDCDMLPLGKVGKGFREERSTKFTKDEQMTMMTLWCIFGSPLMLGAELTQMDPWTLSLLTKEEILKMVSNDFVGKQLERDEDHAVWSCYNKKTDEKYVAYFNLKEEKQTITADWNQIAQFTVEKDQKVREIWSEENTTVEQGILSVDVEAHGVKLYSCQ